MLNIGPGNPPDPVFLKQKVNTALSKFSVKLTDRHGWKLEQTS